MTRIATTTTYVDGNTSFLGPVSGSYGGSAVKTGYTVGVGAEYALGNSWTVKAEYLYADYGSYGANLGGATVTTVGPFVQLSPFAPAGTVTTTTTTVSSAVRTRFTDNVFRLGLNYRLSP